MDMMTAVVGKPGNKYAKDIIAKYSQQSEPKSKAFDANVDEKDFQNALGADGFDSYSGNTMDGVSAFGDDAGNSVYISAGSVYSDEKPYAVSGYNEDDDSDTNYKSFDSKDDAIAYAKQLGQKLRKQNPNKKYEPNSNEPESKGGLPSDERAYRWSMGDMKMPVDKELLKSVNKLSTKLKLNQKGSFSDIPKAEYERKMLSLVHDALEDANFHGANRQIFADLQGRPELAKRPDYSNAPKPSAPGRDEWMMKNSIYNKNFDAITIPMNDAQDAISDLNAQSGWDGEKTLAALLAKMRNDGAGVLADKIQTSFETAMKNNEAKLKLGDLI
jgi:hypothetical protein